ncbi:hypothetical protein ACN38_g10327 [Penicillium nordicum]|uniref:Ig-like domain-containing protein n=1 Tax=Penicillium nordicum TaxID=229535 RepID=A0A0M9WBQ6_9EURO|nr:hypothetical protein ACN38_g10327 [Penicillium nordicum]
MKVTIGNVLAATLALTYPVQARNAPLNGRDPVPAVNEADSFQENATPHKGVVTKHLWIRDEASMTPTSSANLNPIYRHPKPSTQLPLPSVAPNGGNNSNQPSATAKDGDQGTESIGTPNSSSAQSNPSEIPSHFSNAPMPPVIPSSRSDPLIPSGIPSHPSNVPEPSVIPSSRSDTPIQSGAPSHPSNIPQPSVTPNSRSDSPSPSGAPHSNQPDASEAFTARSSEPPTSRLGDSSKTNTPPASSQEGAGSDSATPLKAPQQTGSPSATPTFASSNPDSTIESSMMAVTTSGYTTTEAIPVPVTTVEITKGQETSSITFTATSVTTSDGSEPTFAWGCASSDLCGSGTTDSGGGSSGCVVPLLCPSDHNWGLGGGWSPSGSPSPGGPNPPPSTPKTPSGSGSESPDDDPEDDKSTTSTTATDKTSSSTTSTASSTSSPSPSKLRLCMTVAESGTVESTSTPTSSSKATTRPTSSSKATTSATSTPTSASKIRLCMSVAESGSVIATSEAASTTERKSNTITSAPRTFSTSTKDPLCRDRQDPHGPNSCICTSGTSEIWLPVQSNGRCGYTTLPASPTPTETPTTEAQPAPTLGPVTSTTTNDEMIIWPTQTIKYYNVPGTKLTETYPAGEPTTSTMTADTPEATDWNPKGSSICGTHIGDGLSSACRAAWEKYDDDTVYTEKTKRHDSNSLGMGCTAEYTCSEDDYYTPGLNGAQLKELFSSLYDTKGNGISICGSAKLSNGCSVKVDYCSLCKDAN